MPGQCPVCSGELAVARLECDQCGTAIEGSFDPSPFARLTPEQQEFVIIFLRARGNIKEVERELSISYPTVRARLDAVLEALGYRVDRAAAEEELLQKQARRREVLERLSRGEITAEEAVAELKSL
nr:MAG: hypothetical protein DIU55_13940 [Bacillota bacterium]